MDENLNPVIQPSPDQTPSDVPPVQTPGLAPTPPVKPVAPPPLTPFLPESPHKNNHEGLKSIGSTLAIIILAPIVAFCLTAFVFQSYEVDGASMETTLQNQDRLIVLKLPRTLAKITHHSYIPARGDVIIFDKKDLFDTGSTSKRQLVKRVIGLPGDRVVIKNGEIKIYNSAHPEGFEPDRTLPYGSVINMTSGNIDLTIAPGQIFVCGDNRGNSLDSRYFGPIAASDVVGKLELRIFPFNKIKLF